MKKREVWAPATKDSGGVIFIKERRDLKTYFTVATAAPGRR